MKLQRTMYEIDANDTIPDRHRSPRKSRQQLLRRPHLHRRAHCRLLKKLISFYRTLRLHRSLVCTVTVGFFSKICLVRYEELDT